ncbi:hypothetical protein LXL04_035282 [Taraxacum kok-saghyz]
MDKAAPSDKYDVDPRGPSYDSDFEVSDFEGDTSSVSEESGFVVDPDLDDSDVEANNSQPRNDVHDTLLYDFRYIPERNDNIEDEAIKEDGEGVNTAELDRESDDEADPT